jgi:hypothetical protein
MATELMRSRGVGEHPRRGSVSSGLMGLMVLGSVAMAFFGACLLHLVGSAKATQETIELVLVGSPNLGRSRVM